MNFDRVAIAAMVAAMCVPGPAIADDDELEFEEAYLYFELNDTDGDLGIHGKVDGDAWRKVAIEGPDDNKIMDVMAKSTGLRRQGLTELFFESAEPTFDELDPLEFFSRFPEGAYEWEGVTIDGEEIEGEVFLSQIIPAAPVVAAVGGLTDNPGFEEDEGELEKVCWEVEVEDGGVTIEWEPVEESHFDKWSNGAEPLPGEADKIPLGVPGDVEVAYYEFVAEIDDTEYKSATVVPPDVTEWTIPVEFLELAEEEEVKFEIIVRVETGDYEVMDDDELETIESTLGNQSAVEDCFEFELEAED